MDEISICGLCRAPIQNGHGGLRHFGTFTAHQEHECMRILHARIAELERERDIAITYLAEWCVAVDENGTGWDDWDEYYKDAMYRPTPIRTLLDAEIAEVRKMYKRGSGDE